MGAGFARLRIGSSGELFGHGSEPSGSTWKTGCFLTG
jgi:hypothetical protein